MKQLSLLALLALCLNAQAAVYKWVDKDGKVHYSDKPQENAEVVDLKETSANQIRLEVPAAPPRNDDKPEAIEYQISILSPEQDETIRNNDGDFNVSASITPEPPANALWVLRIDGKVWNDAMEVPFFNVKGIDRGEHSIEVQLIARNGKVIASSKPRTLFLHRTSVLQQPKAVPLSGN
ncbi:DUF4124 domain-containing protein [Shewanella sp.]|uniref:DUF4124 domain-containing protein n=1 Tax=Shewanella sp. TaxID=50422 RepID=UPI00356AB452